jgi:pseudouridine synthase
MADLEDPPLANWASCFFAHTGRANLAMADGMMAGHSASGLQARVVSTDGSIRLNKFISDSGHCSRREADKLIDSNRVKINGRRPELGTRVEAGDVVTIDGQEVLGSHPSKSDRVYLAYNKPVGITCTTEHSVKGNIVDAIDHDQRIFPIGRLDKPSEGLILLTSDGDIVNKILRAENAHEKEYLVTVNKNIGPEFAAKMSRGIPILDTVTKPCKVNVVGRSVFRITLTQGLNRQIRRMCEYLGYEVVQLVRLRVMNVELGRLKPGQWRNLNHHEMEQLSAAIASSKGESSQRKSPSPAKKRKPRQGGRADGSVAAPSRKPARKARPGKSSGRTEESSGKPGRKSRPEKSARGIEGQGDSKRTSSRYTKPGKTTKQGKQTKPGTQKAGGTRNSSPASRRRK